MTTRRVASTSAPLALLALLANTLPSARAQDPVSAPPDLGPGIQERLAAQREQHGLPAMGGLLLVNGEVAGVAAVGSRRRGSPEAVTVDDPWHLGSCTKAMTATLAARLVERGALAWDTTLAEVFADRVEAMDPSWRGVTLEQLLSHRSGAPANLPMDATWTALLFDRETPLPALRLQVLASATARPTQATPGERFEYSNLGYALAGAMCEQVAGAPYEQLLREVLFAPLGMKHAGFGAPGSSDAIDAPRGHRRERRRTIAMSPGPLADNPPAIAPAGTVHAPLRDWGAFARLHLRGARGEEDLLLEPETFRALHAPRGQAEGEEGGYALGWGVTPGGALMHSGSNTMWFCTVALEPKSNVGALVTTNCGGEAAEAACAAAIEALLALAREHAAR